MDYIVQRGGVITDAISSQQWPGDATVHVSITNWLHQPQTMPSRFELDETQVDGITTRLRPGHTAWEPTDLPPNRAHSFFGAQPTGEGFFLSDSLATKLLADLRNAGRIRRYLTSKDIAEDPRQAPTRWIIDFGTAPLEAARTSPDLLAIVERDVRPTRLGKGRHFERLWWQFAWPRGDMRAAIEQLDGRYVAATATGKRFFATWQDDSVLPSNAAVVFAFDDDYSMGILLSKAHDAWAWEQSSTLETRLRYTPTSVFETFPWPHPVSDEQREAIAEASRVFYARRNELCVEHDMGLTKLYNLMDDGAFCDLAALHKRLDEAVVEAYGWPKSIAQDADALVARLTERNREIAEGERRYSPFASDNTSSATSSMPAL